MASATAHRPEKGTRSARTGRPHREVAPASVTDRILLVAAVVGLLVSAYLAVVDLTGGSTLCLAGSDCDIVRASAYGRVAGLPLAVLGVGYFATVLLSAVLRAPRPPAVLQTLGGLGLGAAVVFVVLQGLVLRAWCPYCLVADLAALAIGLRALWPRPLTVARHGRTGSRSSGTLRVVAGALLAVAVLSAGYILTLAAASSAATRGTASNGASASALSPDQLSALADHLRESGAVFYGSYWCPHCQNQKQMFGDAAARLPYVECDPRGTNAQPSACDAAGVRAFPTWVIGGQKFEGEVAPAELAQRSGFQG